MLVIFVSHFPSLGRRWADSQLFWTVNQQLSFGENKKYSQEPFPHNQLSDISSFLWETLRHLSDPPLWTYCSIPLTSEVSRKTGSLARNGARFWVSWTKGDWYALIWPEVYDCCRSFRFLTAHVKQFPSCSTHIPVLWPNCQVSAFEFLYPPSRFVRINTFGCCKIHRRLWIQLVVARVSRFSFFLFFQSHFQKCVCYFRFWPFLTDKGAHISVWYVEHLFNCDRIVQYCFQQCQICRTEWLLTFSICFNTFATCDAGHECVRWRCSLWLIEHQIIMRSDGWIDDDSFTSTGPRIPRPFNP